MSATLTLSAFLSLHRSDLVIPFPPTAAQTKAAVAVLKQARLDFSEGIEVSKALFDLAGSQSWHNDWLLAARDQLEAERKEKQRLWVVARNRTRDAYIGRLDRRGEPTNAEWTADSENWEWAMDRFHELTERREGESFDDYADREDYKAAEIRDAYGCGDSEKEAATWFFEHTTTGPEQIEAEFPGLWAATIADCRDDSE